MSSSPPQNAELVAALKDVVYPGYSRDIVSFGLVKGVTVEGDRVEVRLQLSNAEPETVSALEAGIRKALTALEGVGEVTVQLDPGAPRTAPEPAAAGGIEGVSRLIAVASGKGGVGKSTLAVNLAVALGRGGASTGLLDSDIYGPSIPLMMGIRGQPASRGNLMIPLENHGVRTMSIGYLLADDDSPVIWRGPMVMKALTQFLRQVQWGALDYLVIDLPPGTGDAVLTLVQSVPLTGAIVVTTPQDVALIDAKKAVAMFRKTEVPVLGIVENMSVYTCPSCGHQDAIFGAGGGKREAERQDVPFLGEIPLEPHVRLGGDQGEPIVISEPGSPAATAFQQIAGGLRQSLESESG